MTVNAGQGVEWGGGGNDAPVEKDGRGWVLLHADEPCDGVNPATGRSCARGYHRGYHRDAAGTEWLDE